MPFQNRVDPFGNLHAVSEKGSLMGNRGILHDAVGRIRHTHRHQNWVTCALDFKGRRRSIMTPGRYTELFFLDEATAFAAGHRPCGECRRDRYRSFLEAWIAVHGRPSGGTPIPRHIDRALHAGRIARGGRKVTYMADCRGLPDGTMVARAGAAFLITRGHMVRWSFAGYAEPQELPAEEVTVLTPKPLADLFASGWRPHAAAWK